MDSRYAELPWKIRSTITFYPRSGWSCTPTSMRPAGFSEGALWPGWMRPAGRGKRRETKGARFAYCASNVLRQIPQSRQQLVV